MIGRISFVVALVLAVAFLPAVSFAGGGVAVAVPSCQSQAVQLQGIQAHAPVAFAAPLQIAVPVYSQQVQLQAVQSVQAVQAVQVQRVQVLQANRHDVRIKVVNEPRTAFGAAIQAFRDRRFGR